MYWCHVVAASGRDAENGSVSGAGGASGVEKCSHVSGLNVSSVIETVESRAVKEPLVQSVDEPDVVVAVAALESPGDSGMHALEERDSLPCVMGRIYEILEEKLDEKREPPGMCSENDVSNVNVNFDVDEQSFILHTPSDKKTRERDKDSNEDVMTDVKPHLFDGMDFGDFMDYMLTQVPADIDWDSLTDQTADEFDSVADCGGSLPLPQAKKLEKKIKTRAAELMKK